MLFNSLEFVVFAPLVLLAAALLRGWPHKLFLVLASYLFYGWAQPAFCLLLAASTVIDYTVALRVHAAASPRAKRAWLAVSVLGNLGMLGYFKYAGFFAASINSLTDAGVPVPQILLPAGISFYTFQTLSYTIDVYRGKLAPTRSFLTMALYVAFFPQLVAGPIERASHLMTQLHTRQPRSADAALSGVSRIVWGLMKKVVFADWVGMYFNAVYDAPAAAHGWELALATTCFALLIYLDFSAYSDIAIGLARCCGIDLRENFKHPYLARNASEFWRRWHISLSEWLRDYLYIPLGGSRKGTPRTLANLLIVMFLGGLWHGAGWTFVAWGLWHGLGLVLYHAWSALRPKAWGIEHRAPGADGLPRFRVRDAPAIALTFVWVWLSWIPFAARPTRDADGQIVASAFDNTQLILRRIVTESWTAPSDVWVPADLVRVGAFLSIAVLAHVVRGLSASRDDKLNRLAHVRTPWLTGVFWGLCIATIALGYAPVAARFIYFQF